MKNASEIQLKACIKTCKLDGTSLVTVTAKLVIKLLINVLLVMKEWCMILR